MIREHTRRSMSIVWSVAVAATVVLSACGQSQRDNLEGYTTALDMLPEPNMDIDILFVVDNSGSMMAEQANLAQWAQQYLFGVIELEAGILPNLHIGVVSTDMGADGSFGTGCSDSGDDGAFRVWDHCPVTGSYIVDVAKPDGTRERNYEGTLGDAFGCVAQLGVNGCGFEQPFASAARALERAAGNGFLREDALLAVILITDEDDCSAAGTGLFDTSDVGVNSPLGPLSSYRCFEFGVICNEMDPRAPGPRTGCVATESQHMAGIQPFADALVALKNHPSMVMVAGIYGDASPIEVERDEFSGLLRLLPSCQSEAGEAAPGVRVYDFLRLFPGRYEEASICDGNLIGPLQTISTFIGGTAARGSCLRGSLRDRDETTVGVQPTCQVTEVRDVGTPNEERKTVRLCADGDGGQDCYRIVEDPASCSGTETQLAVRVPERASRFVVDCQSE